jgi:hypothetical protein
VQEYRQQLDASNATDQALAEANEHLASIEAKADFFGARMGRACDPPKVHKAGARSKSTPSCLAAIA